MKGIIYGRVSTTKQDYTRQVNELQLWASKNDIEVIEVFTDVVSGRKSGKDRKAFAEMQQFIKDNKIGIILVSELSRVGRSAMDVQINVHRFVYELELDMYIYQQGLRARDLKGKLNPIFKLMTDVLANVASIEVEQTRERIKSGLDEARRKGKTLGRPDGSGYDAKRLLSEHKDIVRELERNGRVLPKDRTSLRKIAKICAKSLDTVQRVKKAMATQDALFRLTSDTLASMAIVEVEQKKARIKARRAK